MAKKIILALVFVSLIIGNAFAQTDLKISIGAGGYFTSDFGGGVEAKVSGIKAGTLKTPYAGGGAFVFFDATFLELNLGIFGAGGEWEEYGYGVGTFKYDVTGSGLDIGLFGKYPIMINDNFSLFPLLGISYRAILSAKLDGEKADDPGDLSALWFKFGGGIDYSFTENIFFRAGILYGFRLKNKFEKDLVDLFDAMGAKTDTLLGNGLEIKLAIGYRF